MWQCSWCLKNAGVKYFLPEAVQAAYAHLLTGGKNNFGEVFNRIASSFINIIPTLGIGKETVGARKLGLAGMQVLRQAEAVTHKFDTDMTVPQALFSRKTADVIRAITLRTDAEDGGLADIRHAPLCVISMHTWTNLMMR